MLCMLAVCSCHAEEKSPAGIVPLSDWDKAFLVNLARQTLALYLSDRSRPNVDKSQTDAALLQTRPCFVTLDKKVSGLRGCIGMFESSRPLYENVIDRAIAAATQDPRFPPVRYDELKDIKLEISVLTAPQDLPFDSPEDLLAKLKPLVHGVLLETRYGGSTFLPQVWEQLPDKEEFLAHLCMKHGAPADTWRKDYKHVQVQTYQAVVFGEEAYGRRVIGKNGAVVGPKGATALGTVIPPKDGAAGRTNLVAGAALAPGAIVSADSDVKERN